MPKSKSPLVKANAMYQQTKKLVDSTFETHLRNISDEISTAASRGMYSIEVATPRKCFLHDNLEQFLTLLKNAGYTATVQYNSRSAEDPDSVPSVRISWDPGESELAPNPDRPA